MTVEQIILMQQITTGIMALQLAIIVTGLVYALKLRKSTKLMAEWMRYYRGERKDPPTA